MESYGAVAARHYAAYRPPLHARIIGRALGDRRAGGRYHVCDLESAAQLKAQYGYGVEVTIVAFDPPEGGGGTSGPVGR